MPHGSGFSSFSSFAGSLSRLDEDRLEELPLALPLDASLAALLEDDEEGREVLDDDGSRLEELEDGRLLLDEEEEELDGGRRPLEELLGRDEEDEEGSLDDEDRLRELELLDEDKDLELELRLLEERVSSSGGGLALIATMCATWFHNRTQLSPSKVSLVYASASRA